MHVKHCHFPCGKLYGLSEKEIYEENHVSYILKKEYNSNVYISTWDEAVQPH